MADELLKSKYLLRYWLLVGLYVLLLAAFLCVAGEPDSMLEYALVGALILGPALAYPVAFYLNSTVDERKYVKQLSEMWAPVWAALSFLVAAISRGDW